MAQYLALREEEMPLTRDGILNAMASRLAEEMRASKIDEGEIADIIGDYRGVDFVQIFETALRQDQPAEQDTDDNG